MMLNHLLSRQAIDYATPTWFCQKPYHYNRHNNAKMNIIDNNISYVIPLDEIDLNYCSGKGFFSDEPMPLWNKNSNNYYELKIFAQKKRQLSQNEINGADQSFTKNLKYKCHVCNLSVPIVYKKEHINSEKHTTCLKIMDIAMDRARRCLIQSKDDNQQLKPAQHSYYCKPCCTEVKIVNRKDHDMSKDHFKSLMHDKFLDDLLKIYIDKEHLEKVDFECMTNDSTINHSGNANSKKYKSDSDISYEDVNVNDEINKFLDLMQNLNDGDDRQNPCNESVNETSKSLSLTDNEVSTSNEIQDYKLTITNGTQVMHLNNYIKMLLSNDNSQLSHKIKVNGRNQVEIEAADKTVLTVPEDNFHSFTRDYLGKANFCKLCALPFVDENSHKMAPEHMKRVMAPIQDMHGIRQGRNSTTAHCILCNTSLITKEGHIASFIHKNSLTALSLHTVTKDPNSKVTAQPNAAQAKTGITYCQPCDRLIHTNNFDAHTKGAIHKTNVKAEIDRKSNETDNNINKANVIVPTSSLNTVTKEQNSKVTAQPNAAQTKTGTTYCQPCDRLIHTHNFDAHTKGAIHKTNVNTKAKNKTHCAPCNIYVDTNNLNSHLSGQRHKTNVDLSKSAKTEQLLETKASTSRRDPATESQNYCDVCEKYVNKTQFSCHVNGGPHKQNLIKKFTKEVANFNTSHLKIKNNKVICEICEVEFDITKSKLHVNSATHDETLNRILEKNKIEKESDCLFCSLCCDNISNNELVAHVSMSTHKKLLACSNFQYYCEICDVYVPDTEFNINGHVNGNRHKKNCVDHNSP